MNTRTDPLRETSMVAHQPDDRLVVPGHRGVWEVRQPGASTFVLCADNQHTAIEWAWNITQSTGGQVIVHPLAGSCRECEPLL